MSNLRRVIFHKERLWNLSQWTNFLESIVLIWWHVVLKWRRRIALIWWTFVQRFSVNSSHNSLKKLFEVVNFDNKKSWNFELNLIFLLVSNNFLKMYRTFLIMISDSPFFLETPNCDLSQCVCKLTSILVGADAIFVHIFTKDESFR